MNDDIAFQHVVLDGRRELTGKCHKYSFAGSQFTPKRHQLAMRSRRQQVGLASAAVLAIAASSKGRVIVGAFAPSSTSTFAISAQRGPRHATSLYDILPRDDDGSSRENNSDDGGANDDEKDAAIESARERLEALVSTTSSQ